VREALVTGGSGYIGSAVTHGLSRAERDVVVFDHLPTGPADGIPADARFHRLPVYGTARVRLVDVTL
jgi:nucleoside-diphosphate-sugar epimerase